MRFPFALVLGLPVLGLPLLGALVVASPQDSQPSPCAALTQLDPSRLPNPTTRLDSAVVNAARDAQGNTPAYPEHCEVVGRINERTGVNGQRYAIRFHLRLPAAWNGGFYFEGGGGSNGNLGTAFGNLQGQQRTTAMALGYAVVSQNAGHDNATNNDPERNGTLTFGFDPQARRDHGYNSYDQVTQAGKALVRAFYGRPAARSYFVGCSEGGREAMVMAQRFPDYFDGILACAPGFKLPKAAVIGHSWDVQSLAEVSKATGIYDRQGQPLLNKTFTDEDLDLASQAILAACDALDGLGDGIIDNFSGCSTTLVTEKLSAVACKGPKRVTCLMPSQVTALQKLYTGARDANGEVLYSDWAWDRGLGGRIGDAYNQGWRAWKLGAYDASNNSAIIATLGSASASALFTTPPTPVAMNGPGPLAFLMGITLPQDASKVMATSGEFAESPWDFMMASSTDLTKFRARNGKLVLVHGVSDPVFSVNDTVRWWNDVNRESKGAAPDVARLFAVPGMNHCAGGPSTDQYNAFGALVGWVEKGAAPDRIVATAGPNTPWPGRTRPLCAYPTQARYTGSGSIEDAANFVCR
jgi:poly(3-hydroxybutyrate) depolymerase